MASSVPSYAMPAISSPLKIIGSLVTPRARSRGEAITERLRNKHGGPGLRMSIGRLSWNETVRRFRLVFLEVTSTPNYFFGKNVFNFASNDTITLSGGSEDHTSYGVYGWPNVSLNQIPTGEYTLQAFLNQYETVSRSDGSTISIRFPCGDGALNVNGPGSLATTATNFTVSASQQTVELSFASVVPQIDFNGTEIGGCSQGNYEDTETVKYVKIRSEVLSKFWNRDMYVGANVKLPFGYNASDAGTRYPVIYSQDHWAGGDIAFAGFGGGNWTTDWDNGIIPGVNGTADLNTANLGPYGDAINDELIPHLDAMFNTIAEPYARIQEGGSTGGWESAANLIFRPDLFGACFSSYPDSLDFHRHQDIPLYDNENAYTTANRSAVYSIREVINGTLTEVTTVAQENHWELTYGTSSRSSGQWDIWNAVFGVQGLNGYPLEPWDKVTGEIYPQAVEYWKPMDLSNYITSNWNNTKNLGSVLKGRVYIYVGSWDNYYLNEGVEEFQKRTDAKGGAGWANVTVLANQTHGGLYQRREIWNYLEFLDSFIKDHAPDGKTPLSTAAVSTAARGNQWEEVIARGGHDAALARQADPKLNLKSRGQGRSTMEASVGRWDPGVMLRAQWVVDGKDEGEAFRVKQQDTLVHKHSDSCKLQLKVTGRKRNYADETRWSSIVET
ncbi:Putative alpha/Beta hydrolase [Septoria linicola]|uniref:Alpha/Beta hydrolase n=1 Tax=Septoria linicola TaxID=215465 RepID=A0A9Q9AXV1_9PEZI|nr:Putative alpha/Beta hydrolase [Septoria linicola]